MTIDDLFSGDPDAPVPTRERPGFLRVLSLLAISALLTAFAFAGLRAAELSSPLPVLFATALVLVGVWRLVWRTRPRHSFRQTGRAQEDRERVPDGVLLAIARWDTMMDWSHTDAERFNRKVLPRLAEVVDERLRQRHGIDRASDPLRARTILGDPLWTFVTMPSRRPPHPRDLDQIVSALEKL